MISSSSEHQEKTSPLCKVIGASSYTKFPKNYQNSKPNLNIQNNEKFRWIGKLLLVYFVLIETSTTPLVIQKL